VQKKTYSNGTHISVTFALNGGNIDGNMENIEIYIKPHTKLRFEEIPQNIKYAHHIFDGWYCVDTNKVLTELQIAELVFTTHTTFIALWKTDTSITQ